MVDDSYKGLAPGFIGIEFPSDRREGPSSGDMKPVPWISKEDQERNDEFDENFALYKGHHGNVDGGPFPHPYGAQKAIEEDIPYIPLNLLGDISGIYADLVLGDGFSVSMSKSDDAEELIKFKDFQLAMWNVVALTSVYGFTGIQPFKTKDAEGNDKVWWMAVRPHYIFFEWQPGRPEIRRIFKRIPLEVEIGETTKEILYQETHTPGRVQFDLFERSGNDITGVLPLEFYTDFVDPSTVLIPSFEIDSPFFLLTIIANEMIEQEFHSDYTLPSKMQQRALNTTITSMNRVIEVHANPRLVLPRSMLRKGEKQDGRYEWDMHKEMIFYDEKKGSADVLIKFLTWDGQLEASRGLRDFLIQAIAMETDMTPSLFSFTDLIAGGPADTAAKLERMMYKTKQRVKKKRSFFVHGLVEFFFNFFMISDRREAADDFQIDFLEAMPEDRRSQVEEAVSRKASGILSTHTALKRLDKMTDEEAAAETRRIMDEKNRAFKDPFDNSGIIGEPA